MDFRRRKLAFTVARFVGGLTAFLLPWPGVASLLVRLYVGVANFYLFCSGAGASVRLFAGLSRAVPWNVEVFFRAARGPVLEAASLDAWRTFHLPLGVFFGLCVAHAPRRSWHVIPMAVVGAVPLIGLPLTTLLEHAIRLGLRSVPGPLFALLVTANRALWAPAGMAFIVPAATWLALLWAANRIARERSATDS